MDIAEILTQELGIRRKQADAVISLIPSQYLKYAMIIAQNANIVNSFLKNKSFDPYTETSCG